jgi:hypothetical protein
MFARGPRTNPTSATPKRSAISIASERAGGREQARGVQPTGIGEHRLRRTQLVGQPGQDAVRDRRVGGDLART